MPRRLKCRRPFEAHGGHQVHGQAPGIGLCGSQPRARGVEPSGWVWLARGRQTGGRLRQVEAQPIREASWRGWARRHMQRKPVLQSVHRGLVERRDFNVQGLAFFQRATAAFERHERHRQLCQGHPQEIGEPRVKEGAQQIPLGCGG